MSKRSESQSKLVLALDTASDALALAVGEIVQQGKGNEQSIRHLAFGDRLARREANVCLVPAIENMFAGHGLNKDEIACIVCGRGPGSFTGVRIAVATAKGLAAGLQVPLFGVATPDALAWQAWQEGVRGHLAVLLDAMRGEVYPARYVLNEQGAQREDPLTVVKAATLAERWQGSENSLVLIGDALYKYGEFFEDFTMLNEHLWRAQGTGLLRAFDAQPKDSGNIAALLPVYTRLSDAEENERKRLAEGGALAQGALLDIPASGVAWPQKPEERTFRPAAAGDTPLMEKLEKSSYPRLEDGALNRGWTESLFRTDIGLADRSWWVCYRDNALVGYVGGQLLDGQMHVLDLVVSEPCRRQGIARKLLWLLAQDAKDLGATELTLEVRANNAAAQALYAGLGLVEAGRRRAYYAPLHNGETREDALIMTGSVDVALEQSDEDACLPPPRAQTLSKVSPLILAIESSCDETAAALIDGEGRLLENVVASQTDFHARFGGVVPEIASRKHTEAIYPVVMEALGQRNWSELDAIAVTYAPGLIGALVVGVAFAKGLCWATGLPLITVNHLEGHIYANRFVQRCLEVDGKESTPAQPDTESSCSYQIDAAVLRPPFIIALLSGGNTLLVHVRSWGSYEVLGQTLDDAVGEAYDKVAKALGLGYPGGPIIAQLAAEGNPKAVDFPRALLHSGNYQFSLSGLKTAVLTVIRQQVAAGTLNLPDIAASFEQAVIDVQVSKALKACKSLRIDTFCIGGGVAANKALRRAYKDAMEPQGIRVVFPPALACTDNAAMIAAVALDRYSKKKFSGLSSDAAANADLELDY